MTFRDVINKTYERYHFSEDYFAEAVTYTPVGGLPRRIVVHIDDSGSVEVDGVTSTPTDEIVVLALRDPLLGIDQQRDGDMIQRDADKEPEQRAYFYQRQHESQRPGKTRLYFSRYKREIEGTRQ